MRRGTRKFERELADLRRELAKTPRRPRKVKRAEHDVPNGPKPPKLGGRPTPRWTPPAPKSAIVSSRPQTRQGVTFHMAFATVRVEQDQGSRLSRHQQYIERPSAAATLDGLAGRDVELELTPGYDAEGRPGRYHQRYLEDGNVELHGRRPISFGTIGDTPEERDEFWRVVEATSRRNGILQHRIICELPWELTPAAHAEIMQEFSKVFTERELPFWIVVHAPDKHNDARNFHAHIVYYHRPSKRLEDGQWDFAFSVIDRDKHGHCRRKFPRRRPFDRRTYEKDTERVVDGKVVRVPGWYRELRETYCKIMNDALARAGVSKRYTPLSYAKLGVKKRPSEHLGPKCAARERSGKQTGRGGDNGAREAEFAATRIPAASFAGRVQIDAFISQAERLRSYQIPPTALPTVLAAEQATQDYIHQTEVFLELVAQANAHDTYESRRDAAAVAEIAAMRQGVSKVHPADRSRHYTALLGQRRELAHAADVGRINADAREKLEAHAKALGAARSHLNQLLFDAEQAILEPASMQPIGSMEVPTLAHSQIKITVPGAAESSPRQVPTPGLTREPLLAPAPSAPERRPTASAAAPAPTHIPAQAPAVPAPTVPAATVQRPTASAAAPAGAEQRSTSAQPAPAKTTPTPKSSAAAPQAAPAAANAPKPSTDRPAAQPSVRPSAQPVEPQRGPQVASATPRPETPASAIETPIAPQVPPAPTDQSGIEIANKASTSATPAQPPSAQPVTSVAPPAQGIPAPIAPTPAARPAAPPTAAPAGPQPTPAASAAVAAPARPTAAPARAAALAAPAKPDRPDGIREMAAKYLVKLPRDRFPAYVAIYKHSTLPLQQQKTFGKLFTTDVELLKRQLRDTMGALHHVRSMTLSAEQEPWRSRTTEMLRAGANAVQRIATLNGWQAHVDPAQWSETVASDALLNAAAWHFKFSAFTALPKAVQDLALARRAEIAKRLGQAIPGAQQPRRPTPAPVHTTPRRPDRGR